MNVNINIKHKNSESSVKDCLLMQGEFTNLNLTKPNRARDSGINPITNQTYGLSTEQLKSVKSGSRANGSNMEINIPEKLNGINMSDSELVVPRFQDEVNSSDQGNSGISWSEI